MKDVTVCLTHFRGLTAGNLAAALETVRRQDLSRVGQIVVVNNGATYDYVTFDAQVNASGFPEHIIVNTLDWPQRPNHTHAWSTNLAVSRVEYPVIFFTRSDYLLADDAIARHLALLEPWPSRSFVVSNGRYLTHTIEQLEVLSWRTPSTRHPHANWLLTFPGTDYDHGEIDAGVWCTHKATFNLVGGLDERLTSWGHSQTEFQHRLYLADVKFIRIPEILHAHVMHGGERDLKRGNAQAHQLGMNVADMWNRYHGRNPYR